MREARFLCFALVPFGDSNWVRPEREPPAESIPGIILAISSLVVMPLLIRAKRKVARSIKGNALAADAKQTELCTYLSATILGGLLLNSLLGRWWALSILRGWLVDKQLPDRFDIIVDSSACAEWCDYVLAQRIIHHKVIHPWNVYASAQFSNTDNAESIDIVRNATLII